MLFILTGNIQTGKTRFLERLVTDTTNAGGICEGVIAPGIWVEQNNNESDKPSFEKLGIDNVLLPESKRIRFATRRDLLCEDKSTSESSESKTANLKWAIEDAAIDAVNNHFKRIINSWNTAATQPTNSNTADSQNCNQKAATKSSECSTDCSTDCSTNNPPHLLVVDELGYLELELNEGLTDALRAVDIALCNDRHTLIVVREKLLPLAEQRFAKKVDTIKCILPDEEGRYAVLNALGL